MYATSLTMLDYFAIHGDAPSEEDIAMHMSWMAKDFDKEWGKLSNDERFRIRAEVRYHMAYAMSVVRDGE